MKIAKQMWESSFKGSNLFKKSSDCYGLNEWFDILKLFHCQVFFVYKSSQDIIDNMKIRRSGLIANQTFFPLYLVFTAIMCDSGIIGHTFKLNTLRITWAKFTYIRASSFIEDFYKSQLIRSIQLTPSEVKNKPQ